MKKIKNNSLDIKIIIGSLVMVVGLFVMAFFFFPNNNQNVNTNNEIAKASTGFTATRNLTGGSSIEYLSSNTIHIVSGNVTYSNSITGSGRTTVIYLEPNATLTVRSQSNGWAGIEITSGTLIIVGGAGSKVYAYGVDADNGQDGAAGTSGYISGKYYYTGAGGKGGKGGHGASAGIGGYGGAGGSGGAGGGKIYYNGSDWVGYTKE